MILARVLVLLIAAAGGGGCQQAPPPAAPSIVPSGAAEASVERLRARGDDRRQHGDHAGALQAYEQAVTLAPEDVSLRYLLAITLVELDRRPDAIAAFRWLVERGPETREEVRMARQWLVEAGALDSVTVAPAASAPGSAGATGRLAGRTEWPQVDAREAVQTLQVLLDGDDASTRGRRYSARVALNQPYRIDGIESGRYRVIAGVGATKLWQLTVTVRAGEPTALDLTPATSTAPRDALKSPSS